MINPMGTHVPGMLNGGCGHYERLSWQNEPLAALLPYGIDPLTDRRSTGIDNTPTPQVIHRLTRAYVLTYSNLSGAAAW